RVDPLKYQRPPQPAPAADSPELMTVKVRYKDPAAEQSRLQSRLVADARATLPQASGDFRFAAAVAAFGMLLRDSPDKGNLSFTRVSELARSGLGEDPGGYRAEFVRLVGIAQGLTRPRADDDRRPNARR